MCPALYHPTHLPTNPTHTNGFRDTLADIARTRRAAVATSITARITFTTSNNVAIIVVDGTT